MKAMVKKFTVLAMLAVLAACGGGGGGSAPAVTVTPVTPAKVPVSITVKADKTPVTQIVSGLQQQFIANARYADGTLSDLSTGVTWTTDAPTVLEVFSTGLVKGLSLGTAKVIATVGSVSASLDLKVVGPYIGVAAGGGHTVAIKSDGTLLAWGLNRNGQLGISATVDKSIPTVVSTVTAVSAVSAGEFHTAALSGCAATGCTLWTWGRNDYGSLGDGTFVGKITPTKITGTDWYIVSAGGLHTAAIKKKDGSLWTWGKNFNNQLGDGTSSARSAPTAIALPLVAYTGATPPTGCTFSGTTTTPPITSYCTVTKPYWGAVATGGAHTLAILTGAATNSSGILFRWGANDRGQLGLNDTIVHTEMRILSGSSPGSEAYKYKAVAAGGEHSLAIRDSGELYSFGSNVFGQLGTGAADTDESNLSVTQVGIDADWEVISAGGSVNPIGAVNEALNGGHSLAIKSDGTLWAWGSNFHGQLGTGTTTSELTPIKIGVDRDWVKVSAGKLHSFAWKQDGSLWGWGYNLDGQLGNATSGEKTNLLVPTRLN